MWTDVYPQDVDIAKRGGIPQQQFERGAIHVVIPCWKGDQDQAIRLLEWLGELGMVQAPFWLACSSDCKVEQMLDLARKAFSIVNWLPDGERMISNWHEAGDHAKSAAGPNSLFRQVAWNFAIPQPKGPWLFLEPDAIPCRRDWYNLISREYEICGKPFMGHHVTPVNHPGVPPHLSGVAVYSPNTPSIAPDAVYLAEVAFDIAGVNQILPNAHFTNLIYHRYRAPGFTSEEDFNARVDTNLAIYHANKDGTIYPFLRKRLGMVSEVPLVASVSPLKSPEPLNGHVGEVSHVWHEKGPTVDIFIKTREHDFSWLEYCLSSIDVHATGFRRTEIRVDSGDKFHIPLTLGTMAWGEIEKKEPGYLWQQVCKLHADQHTNSDFILFMDSDCVLTRPITPDEFIRNGKPVWQYTPLDQARSDQHIWVPVMEKFLGRKPQHEFMRRHPFIVPRWAFEELRTFCKYRHGRSLEEYIMGEADPSNGLALRFSEWNCLGFFLWEYHRDKVEWVLDADAGPACCWQGHTHDTPEKNALNVARMKEVFEQSISQQGAGDGVTRPPLTLQDALAFLASQGANEKVIEDLRRSVAPKKRGGRKKGSKNKPKPPKAVSNPRKATPDSLLLAIHSYPGANETIVRHFPYHQKSGATRIVGIGTTDHGCTFPYESIEIAENAYLKTKGKDDHLCRRLLDTVKWCLTQPEERFIIAEYDTIWLKKMPHFTGINAFLTGGKINGSKTSQYFHNPHCFDRQSGPALVAAMETVLPESDTYPDNSPDLFFGLACERANIEVKCPWKMFTRNSLDLNGDLDLAVQAALDGVHVIHGVKLAEELQSIQRALNERHLELSHAQ